MNQPFKGRVCWPISIRIHFNEHWPNSSHPANKLRFDKVWKIGLKRVFGAQRTHSGPTWGPSVGCSAQNRAPVWSPQQSQQSISVFLTQRFHCTNNGTHTQPRKVQQTTNSVILVRSFEVEKLAAICLNTVSDAWYFLSKIDSNESREGGKSLSSNGQLIIPGLPSLNRPLWLRELTWGQPYYSLTCTHTTNIHFIQRGSRRTNNNIKEVKLPMERFDGPCSGRDRPIGPKLREDESLNWEWEVAN